MENKVRTGRDTLKKSSLAPERDREGCGDPRSVGGTFHGAGSPGAQGQSGVVGRRWRHVEADRAEGVEENNVNAQQRSYSITSNGKIP